MVGREVYDWNEQELSPITDSRLWGLAFVGALLLAGTVFWNQDSAPRLAADKGADVSRGPSTNERNATSPPPTVRREAMDNLSTALLSGALMEPLPGFQAVRPQPPSSFVAAAKQGLGAEKRSAAESASPVELAIEARRDSATASLAELAIEAPPDGAGTFPFASGSREGEGLFKRRGPLVFDDPETQSAPPRVLPFQSSSEETDTVAGLPTALEDSGTDVSAAPEDDDAIPASTGDEIEPAGKLFQSRLSDDDDGTHDPQSFQPDAVEEGHDREVDDQLASKSVDIDPGTTLTEESAALEPEDEREARSSDTLSAVSPDTAMHIERLLDRLGSAPGPIDGVAEPMTLNAIVLFQKEHAREATGETNDQLFAALGSGLFESFLRDLESSSSESAGSPNIARTRPQAETAKSAPSRNRQPEKSVKIYGERYPAKKTQSKISTSDAPKREARAEKPTMRIETRPEASPIQQVRFQARTETIEENAPNAFEACARSGEQREYLKTDSGFVLCEEFSFDAGIRR